MCLCAEESKGISARCVPLVLCICLFSTMSGPRLDPHRTINRKSNDLSEMDHPSYCDSLMQPLGCGEEMELNYCLSIDLKLSKEETRARLLEVLWDPNENR